MQGVSFFNKLDYNKKDGELGSIGLHMFSISQGGFRYWKQQKNFIIVGYTHYWV